MPYQSAPIEKRFMVPIDVVAINIEVITIHYPLNIPTDCFEKCLLPLTQKIKSSLRNRLSDMKIIIIMKSQWFQTIYFVSI